MHRRGCSTGALGSASRSPALDGSAQVRRLLSSRCIGVGSFTSGFAGAAVVGVTSTEGTSIGAAVSAAPLGVPTPLVVSASKITRHAGSTDAGSAFQRDRIRGHPGVRAEIEGSVVLTRASIRRRAVGPARGCDLERQLAQRPPLRVERWLETFEPDVLCLQETKLADDASLMTFQSLGYETLHHGGADGMGWRSCRRSDSRIRSPVSATAASPTRMPASRATCGGA